MPSRPARARFVRRAAAERTYDVVLADPDGFVWRIAARSG
jgi:hypothetical protein